MFDRPNTTTDDPRAEAIRGIERLCEAFDPLIHDPSHSLFPDQKAELAALARIFDLSTNRDPGEVWAEIRTLLAPTAATRGPVAEPLTFMVVEVDPAVAAGVMDGLASAGHWLVGPFESADAAEVSAALHPVDVAVIDINLARETNGVNLARSAKVRWGIPTVMSADSAALSAIGGFADSVLLRPFTPGSLQDANSEAMSPGAARAR